MLPSEYIQSSGAHSIMPMEKLAQAGKGGGCTAPLSLRTFIITYKVAMQYEPAEWADTLTLFHF